MRAAMPDETAVKIGAELRQRHLDVALIVEHYVQQRTVYFDGAVVFDETEAPELVHEETDPGTGRADHIRQSLLADLCNYFLGPTLFPKIGQEQ